LLDANQRDTACTVRPPQCAPGQIARHRPGVPEAERAENEFDPKDPSLGSPVVAWLASPEAGHISGQVIRAMGEHLQVLMG
jgi:hypothetical protein